MKSITKYLFFSDYFIVIARSISQFLIIAFRWVTILFKKNKDIVATNNWYKSKPIFKDQLIELNLNFENILWIECRFHNPRKLYVVKNDSNNIIASYSSERVLTKQEIHKFIYIGDYIKTTNNQLKFWNHFDHNDTIFVIAKGFNKRQYKLSIELTSPSAIKINPIKLKDTNNFSLITLAESINKVWLKNISVNSNKKFILERKALELTTSKNFKFIDRNVKPIITPFIKSNYL